MSRQFDWPSVLDRAATETSVAVLLSAVGQNLVLDALVYMLDRWRWEPMDDTTWDTAYAAVSNTMDDVMNNLMVGVVVWRAGSKLDNELICDGTQYARADYPTLYERLDAVYIVDADNFTVPDLIDRVAIGAGNAYAVGDTGGAASHTLTEAEMPTHVHGYTTPIPNVDLESPGAPDLIAAGVGPVVNTGSAGGGAAHNNLPPYEALTPCIIAF